MQSHIQQAIFNIRTTIEQTALKFGRDPKSIRLLLATKTINPETIKIALETGERLIGENKVQELENKYEALSSIEHETHFIGHLQTNKIKEVVRYASCIQSLDRVELADKLHTYLERENKSIDVLLQVNTSYEVSKSGISPEQVLDFARYVSQYPTLRIKGLMTIGTLTNDAQETRRCFQSLKQVQQELQKLNLPNASFDELSMGMSSDLELAIEEGSTILRVGSAIFGTRS